jgi:hypothetical protein
MLSIASTGSILSIGSAGSILSIRAAGEVGARGASSGGDNVRPPRPISMGATAMALGALVAVAAGR